MTQKRASDDDTDDDDTGRPGPSQIDQSEATRTSKRIASSSFAVPHPPTSPPRLTVVSKGKNKGRKKTTKTTTVETTTTTTKQKVTTKIVREHDPTDGDDGPRRSRRNRTDVGSHRTAVYDYENGFRVKVGERDWAEDPKYAHYYVKGGLSKKKRHNSGKGKRTEKAGEKTSKGKKRPAESEEEEEGHEEDETAGEAEEADPEAEWIQVVVDEEGEVNTKRLFRPASSYEYIRVDRGAVNISFMKTFEESSYSAGAIDLGPNGVKEAQIVKRAHMIFVCTEGEVKVQLHETEFRVKKGDSFSAPCFNQYSITNESSSKSAKLIFFQSKLT